MTTMTPWVPSECVTTARLSLACSAITPSETFSPTSWSPSAAQTSRFPRSLSCACMAAPLPFRVRCGSRFVRPSRRSIPGRGRRPRCERRHPFRCGVPHRPGPRSSRTPPGRPRRRDSRRRRRPWSRSSRSSRCVPGPAVPRRLRPRLRGQGAPHRCRSTPVVVSSLTCRPRWGKAVAWWTRAAITWGRGAWSVAPEGGWPLDTGFGWARAGAGFD